MAFPNDQSINHDTSPYHIKRVNPSTRPYLYRIINAERTFYVNFTTKGAQNVSTAAMLLERTGRSKRGTGTISPITKIKQTFEVIAQNDTKGGKL